MSTHGKQAVITADRIRGPETKPGAKRVEAAARPDTQEGGVRLWLWWQR